jgi:hypothetical protein
MGLNFSIQKMSAFDIRYIQQELNHRYLIITTIKDNNYEKKPLIKGTLTPINEENKINELIINNDKDGIIIYGRNNQDMTVIDKYKQLLKLGLTNVYIYIGGLFEWLLLHKQYSDIFYLENDNINYNLWDYSEPPNSLLLHK